MDLRRQGPVAHITFDRPEKLHAMDAAGWTGLTERLREAGADPAVRAVVLHGSPRAFCAGNDIDEFFRLTTPQQARDYFIGLVLPAMRAVVECDVPVISAVRGRAIGGGAEIVLVSDLAIAGTNATFRLPEARIGVWPTVFAAVAPYTLAHKPAGLLSLTTRQLDADTALRCAVVHEVVDDQDVDTAAERLAETIAEGSRDAIRHTKRFATARLRTDGMSAVHDALAALADDTLSGPDAAEGTRAFREKRTPSFAVAPPSALPTVRSLP
ncbi:enoyl-CoA hydratase/isomerase family protein [Streptomyces sp. Rer75]|uniref:enoyl-CoA hydratase/isomerase family protein n=1 Tax=unclassified Streptomyces TaxID=2593676 RepID=UPI0015CFC029|nr:enoyl-CoA hydratase/isomerase family protein [Streptomyces sp. Rer75]QLH20677.1 enoyl-CoA hydratase/isomerase family protein [Streptomyces sp. Rer75]